jgi:hypothetical protein
MTCHSPKCEINKEGIAKLHAHNGHPPAEGRIIEGLDRILSHAGGSARPNE